MNAKDLSEMMLSGDLDYTPESDAAFIAEQYLRLHKMLSHIVDNDYPLPPGAKEAVRSALEFNPVDQCSITKR